MIDITAEKSRISAVKKFDILDSEPDAAFDRITALSARRFGVPVSLISIVAEDRIWFKSHHGLPISEIERLPGLCSSAILGNAPYVLTDASTDERSRENPLVTGDFGLRFYAAMPLITSDGFRLGTLNVLDFKPREVTEAELVDLQDLASLVMDHMELRLSARRAVDQSKLLAKEIDHRVMNSLQFVSSLLRLQSCSANSENPATILEAAASRVTAVAQVHRHFYSSDTQETSCVRFLERLCAELAEILQKQIFVSGPDENVATTMIQPIGLIVNELVTNAAKQGATCIDVVYGTDGTNRSLTVFDDGNGLPDGFEPEATRGLGMKVVLGLVRQLKGKIVSGSRADQRGSLFEVNFPISQ